MKKIFSLILLSALVLSMTSCGSSSTNQSSGSGAGNSKNIKIGLAAPLTGTEAQYGESIRNGAELAVAAVNANGGIGGRQVEIVAMDDKADPNEAVNIASQFVTNNEILAVLGNFNSSATLASAPVYNKNSLVQVSPASSSPKVSEAGEYTYRVITTDAYQAEVVAKMAKDLGFSKVAFIYEQSDFGLGLLEVFKNTCANEGGIEVVAEEAYTSGQTKDFSTILTKIKGQNPDSIFIGGFYNEAALIMQQAAKLGLSVDFIGVDSLYSEAIIELGKESVEGLKLVGFYFPEGDNALAKEFAAKYNEKYSANPDTYAAYAYDGISLILESLKANGETRDAVKKYLDTVVDYPGVTGKITIDENGDVRTVPVRLIIKDGKFTINK